MSFITSLAGLLVVAVLVHATNYYNYKPRYPYYGGYYNYYNKPCLDPKNCPPVLPDVKPGPTKSCSQEAPCPPGEVFNYESCWCEPAKAPPFPPFQPVPNPKPPGPFPPVPFPPVPVQPIQPAPIPFPRAPQCPTLCQAPKVQLTNCACICPAVAIINCQNGYNEADCQCRPHNNPSPNPPPQCTSFLITETITTPGERPGTPRVVEITGTRTGTPGTRSSRRRRGAGAHVIEKRRKSKTTKTRPGTRPGTVTTVPGAPGRPPTTVQVTRRIPPPCPPGYATDLGTCTCFRFA